MKRTTSEQTGKCKGCSHSKQSGLTATAWVALIAVAVAVLVGFIALWDMDVRGEKGSGLDKEWDFSRQREFDESLLQWKAVAGIRSPLHRPTGLAYRDGKIYIVNKEAVAVLNAAGAELARFELESPGRRIDVGPDGTIYVTSRKKLVLLRPDGQVVATWPAPSDQSDLLSVAVVDDHVAVSDLGLRAVHVYDTSGRFLGDVDGPEKGFKLPSDNFELTDTPEGLLLVANSGSDADVPRIEAYPPSSRRRQYGWGEKGEDIVGFNGCCNPTGMAVFPDGRVVTTEKTLVTIKVFTARKDGTLDSVVAGPEQLGEHTPWDVAIDAQGNVIVLFTDVSMIRVYAPAGQTPAT